ncbi:unnamed protein product [Cyprideis torosa]|uniref:Uncharacterized protein n=1 Tax=Cyprideis torosa TaxID=163714 RepID=A0A7R8W6Z7_9CRUS|nr:unnamed protein product [Cyprideis torosa]CAG0882244.1 unnamed protein product [Cyprideis torosa]
MSKSLLSWGAWRTIRRILQVFAVLVLVLCVLELCTPPQVFAAKVKSSAKPKPPNSSVTQVKKSLQENLKKQRSKGGKGKEIQYAKTDFFYLELCGRQFYPTGRVVGGARAEQWRTATFLHKCGAALLNENWAITAAHCVENVPPQDLLLRLGEYDLATDKEPFGYLEKKVQIIASHPKFDPRTFEFDLALLRFYEPVKFQPNIVPICLPTDDEDFLGQFGYVTGWGRLYEDQRKEMRCPFSSEILAEPTRHFSSSTTQSRAIVFLAFEKQREKGFCSVLRPSPPLPLYPEFVIQNQRIRNYYPQFEDFGIVRHSNVAHNRGRGIHDGLKKGNKTTRFEKHQESGYAGEERFFCAGSRLLAACVISSFETCEPQSKKQLEDLFKLQPALLR